MMISSLRLEVAPLVLAASTAILGDGCAAAGLAAGSALSGLQLLDDRSVERTIMADRETTWGATLDAMTAPVPLDVGSASPGNGGSAVDPLNPVTVLTPVNALGVSQPEQ